MNNDCLNHKNLRLFLSGEIPAAERDAFELHLADCADCRGQLALMFTENAEGTETFAAPDFLKEKEKDLSETKTQPQVIPFPVRRKTYLQWAMAAALIIFFSSIAVYVFRQTSSPKPNETFRQSNSTANSLQLLSPVDGANPSGETIEFHWARVADAKSYTLIVLDEKGDIIAQQSATQESLSLNTSNLKPGKNYFWFVKAKLADGRAIDSHTAKFLFVK